VSTASDETVSLIGAGAFWLSATSVVDHELPRLVERASTTLLLDLREPELWPFRA
jgi:hypothetical protein